MFIMPSNHNNGLKNAQSVCTKCMYNIFIVNTSQVTKRNNFLWDLFFPQMLIIILCITTQVLFFVKLLYLGVTIPSQTVPQIFLQVDTQHMFDEYSAQKSERVKKKNKISMNCVFIQSLFTVILSFGLWFLVMIWKHET